MFEKNILTFNPGWDSNAQNLASFNDVRDLQRQLKAQGVQLRQADESTTGPARRSYRQIAGIDQLPKDANLDKLRQHGPFVTFLAKLKQQWEHYRTVL